MKKLYFLGILLLFPTVIFSQYTFDGSYSPCDPAPNDEYANAFAPDPQPAAGSSTCDVNAVYGDNYTDGGVDYLILGIEHGNNGQANFRIFLNADCDASTGAATAPLKGNGGTTTPVGGAEYYIQFETGNNSSTETFEWDTVNDEWVSGTTGALILGQSCAGTSNFVEFRIPITDLVDECADNDCSAIEITRVLSNSGGSPNSNACDNESIAIAIPTNSIPVPDFTIQEICDPNQTPLEGSYVPFISLDPTGILDADLVDGDLLSYEWSYYYNNNPTAITTGFSNQSGTGITNATTADIATNFSPDPNDIPGDFTFELTLTDSKLCDEQTADGAITAAYTITVDFLNEGECLLLPISLSSFSGEFINDKKAKLYWTTESETDNEFFDIERKFEFEQSFQSIGRVNGAGNSQEQINYSFTDTFVGYDKVQYRIKQTDFDGTFTHSNIISLEKEINESKANLYTTGEEFVVEIHTANENYPNKIEIFNIHGQLVDVLDIETSNQQRFFQKYFSTDGYSKGLFFVSITYENGERSVLKSIK